MMSVNISLLNMRCFWSFEKINKKIKIIKKFKEHKLLTPSIKLKPLIKTRKKKEIITILKNSFWRRLFKKLILVSIVNSLFKNKNISITKNCNKSLTFGELENFESDIKPIQKINPQINER